MMQTIKEKAHNSPEEFGPQIRHIVQGVQPSVVASNLRYDANVDFRHEGQSSPRSADSRNADSGQPRAAEGWNGAHLQSRSGTYDYVGQFLHQQGAFDMHCAGPRRVAPCVEHLVVPVLATLQEHRSNLHHRNKRRGVANMQKGIGRTCSAKVVLTAWS